MAEGSKIRYAALLILLVVTGIGMLDDRFTTPLRWVQGVLFLLAAVVLACGAWRSWTGTRGV